MKLPTIRRDPPTVRRNINPLDNPFEDLMESIQHIKEAEITLSAGFEFFIKHRIVARKCHPYTVSDYRYLQRRWKEEYPGLMLHEITPNHLLHMYAVLYAGSPCISRNVFEVDGEKYTKPVQIPHLNSMRNSFLAVIRYLVGIQLCDAQILAALESVPPPGDIVRHVPTQNRHKRFVTEEEVRKVVGGWPNHASRDAVLLMFLSGGRPGDILHMHKDNLTLVADDFWYHDVPHHKNSHRGHSHLVPFGPECIGILKNHLRLQHSFDGPIFRDPHGFGLNVQSLHQKLQKSCKKYGIERFNFQALRRSFANRIRNTYGPEVEILMCGHTKSVAERHYLMQNMQTMQQVAREAA